MQYLLKKKKERVNQMDPSNLEYKDLKAELVKLRKYLDYKNSGFCKRVLESIIKKYFKKEEIRKWKQLKSSNKKEKGRKSRELKRERVK